MYEDTMNRIERLLWEEANLREMEKRKPRGSTFAKALTIGLVVGVLALLAARPWPPSFYDAREQASNAKWNAQSVAASKPASGVKAPAAAMRGDDVTSGEREPQ